MNRRQLLAALAGGVLARSLPASAQASPAGLADIRAIAPDLVLPAVEEGPPRPGRRVRAVLPQYAGTAVHHALYLPQDWRPDRRYPVLIEYPGNGPYTSPCGDYSSGEVADCALGYGISAGQGFLWAALPCIARGGRANERWWWGDLARTVAYCRAAVGQLCHEFGGDPAAVIFCGFSRGAIASNYIGLHDDAIAKLWRGFVAASHYDGLEPWNYPGSDRAAAERRLARLAGRPSFIAQEGSTRAVEQYLRSTGVHAPFTFETLPFRNHTDRWALRDIPARRALRRWTRNLVFTGALTVTPAHRGAARWLP